jgi:hypothetical protein
VKTLKFSLIILIKFFPSVNGAGKTSSFKMLTGMKFFFCESQWIRRPFLTVENRGRCFLLKKIFGKEQHAKVIKPIMRKKTHFYSIKENFESNASKAKKVL